MSIVFHEGLPRSGKSYEAVGYHIVPALRNRRPVITNINGCDAQLIAEFLGLPKDSLTDLLITPDKELTEKLEVENFFLHHTPTDALVVWDEIQNTHPSGRDKLSPEMTKYITEHGHRGLDILLMGQDRDDVHNLWRRRIQTVVYFLKLEAVGQPDSYRWEFLQKQSKSKFKLTSSGVRKYKAEFFPLYKSHRDETEHKGVYKQKRGSIFGKGLKYGVPLMVVVLGFAINHLLSFFGGQQAQASTVIDQAAQIERSRIKRPSSALSVPLSAREEPQNAEPTVTTPPPPPPPLDYFDKQAESNRLRLSGLIVGEDKLHAFIDALDGTHHLKERFRVSELVAMGWDVEHTEYGLTVTKEDKIHLVRAWPMDHFGRVNNDQRSQLKSK